MQKLKKALNQARNTLENPFSLKFPIMDCKATRIRKIDIQNAGINVKILSESNPPEFRGLKSVCLDKNSLTRVPVEFLLVLKLLPNHLPYSQETKLKFSKWARRYDVYQSDSANYIVFHHLDFSMIFLILSGSRYQVLVLMFCSWKPLNFTDLL